MPLTRFVRRPEVADRLGAFHPFSPPVLPRRLVHPGPTNPAWIGTAFDYLLRFDLERRAPHAVGRPWIAEHVPELFRAGRVSFAAGGDLEKLHPWAVLDPGFALPQLAERAAEVTRSARAAAQRHVADPSPSGPALADLAGHALRLALLDAVFRTRAVRDTTFAEPTAEAVRELLALLDVVPFLQLCTSGDLVLNPEFGPASALVDFH